MIAADRAPIAEPDLPVPARETAGDDARPDLAAQRADEEPRLEPSRFATVIAALRHHRRLVTAIILVVIAAALIAYALIPRRFTARADLWLDHGFEQLGPGVPAAAGSSGSALARNTEVRLLTSGDLAASVVDKLGLANVRGIGQPAEGPLLPRDAARRAAIETVRGNLRVDTNGTSYAVAVRYAAGDPVIATGILNQLVDSYVADRRSGGVRGRARTAMQAQVAAARDETIRAEAGVRGYGEAVSLRTQQDRTALRAEGGALDAAITVAAAEQTDAEARLRAAGATRESGTLTSPRIRDLRARIAARIATPTELDAEVRRVTRLADAVEAARTRTRLLRAARARAAADIKAADQAAAKLKEIGVQAATARARYDDLSRRFAALVSAQRSDPGTAYVISHGYVPATGRFPDPVLFGLGGLIAALLAAGGAVLLLELTSKGFRTRHQLERALGRPVIGAVPDLARVRDADFPADDAMGPPDYLYNHRHSAFSAAFRAIHTGLRLGISGKSLRSVAICSALPEEGKTTVALCLARSAALAGLRVVLVDCDARRPAASNALSPYVRSGLAHVLEDGVDFRRVIQCDTPSGAWFLAQASNRMVANGGLASPKMAALVRQLERDYDLVLLDTAPALALSEARELAAIADGVLLVARARRTPVDAVEMAVDLLDKAGARVVATALTMVDP